MLLKLEKRVKKLVLVLVNSTLMTATRKEGIEMTETAKAVKTIGAVEDDEESEGDGYSGNLA